MWQAIEQSISDVTGQAFTVSTHRVVSGGSINKAACLEGGHRRFFVKTNKPDLVGMFQAEAAGLSAIRSSHTIRAPKPITWGADGENSWLVLEFVEFAEGSSGTSAALGEQLAAMHRLSADSFGWQRDNTIGSTRQINTPNKDWASFFGQHRLSFQLELAAGNNVSSAIIDGCSQLLEVLPSFFTGYKPQPSLLHGDLWGGNWAADTAGEPVIFDPAVYFGDRETDIAMSELFGGFNHRFYQAYGAAWPLDPGYCVRKTLYNLYHILNHYNLFGGNYAHQAQRMINTLLAEVS